MYRPTVRYDEVYRKYVNQLFQATTLDRNQIMRGALFIAAHSNEFQQLLIPYLKKDVPLPHALWSQSDHVLWLEQSPNQREEGRDVNDSGEQIKHQEKRREGAIFSGGEKIKIRNQGGIKITIS